MVADWLKVKTNVVFTSPDVDFSNGKIIITLDDIDELVRLEDELREYLSKELKLPKQKIFINWNDKWRYL